MQAAKEISLTRLQRFDALVDVAEGDVGGVEAEEVFEGGFVVATAFVQLGEAVEDLFELVVERLHVEGGMLEGFDGGVDVTRRFECVGEHEEGVQVARLKVEEALGVEDGFVVASGG